MTLKTTVHVNTVVDKNELTQRCYTLHSQHFSTQFASLSKDHPGFRWGKLSTKVCDVFCFWKLLIFRTSLLSPVLLVVSGSPSSLVIVTTKTGVCCNKSINCTSMEKSFRFCIISGNIFLFTSEADAGMAKIWWLKLYKHSWSMGFMVCS